MIWELLYALTHQWRLKLTAHTLIFLGLLLVFTFLRFYQLDERLPFGWDQVQNSWVMKDMIIDHKLPLEGMVAKGNTGFYIGPAYYYLLVPFYYVFSLDPIAAGVFAGVVSLVTFFTLYFVTKNIFSTPVALIAVGIYTVSAAAIGSDRIAWPVIFIPSVSLLILYFLYRTAKGQSIYLLWLAFVVGFSFHIHFTSIFYLVIIFLTLPFILTQKNVSKYLLGAIPLLALWFIPNMLAGVFNRFSAANNLIDYLTTYYHGFHAVRLAQLLKDAVIDYESLLFFKILKPIATLLLPIFLYTYYREKLSKERSILGYLFLLWFAVPWIIFSVYSGEISNYYFMLTRPLAVMTLAYLTYRLAQTKFFLIRLSVIVFWLYYAVANLYTFDQAKYVVLPRVRDVVEETLREDKTIPYSDGDPYAYLFYIQVLKAGR